MAGIVRVARDKSAVIVKVGDTYSRVSADLSKIDKAPSLGELTDGGAWRKPVSIDVDLFSEHTLLASGEIAGETETVPERQIRLPKTVQRALAENAEQIASNPEALAYIQRLATATTTTASEVDWLKDQVLKAQGVYSALGGELTYSWLQKIDKTSALVAAGEPFSPSDDLEYFGVSAGEDDTKVSGLIAVSREDDLVLNWTPGGFVPAPESVSEYDAPGIIEIDPDTASAVANWINEGGQDTFDILSVDPEVFNLFEMAFAEEDQWEKIDDVVAMLAAAADYTPQERSINAQQQQRQGGGKFGGDGVPEDEPAVAEEAPGVVKATLLPGSEIVPDIAARIAEFLGTAPALAPAAPVNDEPIVAALTPDDPTVSPLYLAVVDPVDHTAVTEAVAIIPDGQGSATGWVRTDGAWAPDANIVADLQGATPPPVVELTDEPTIKDVLSQVDSFDSGTQGTEPESAEPSAVPVTASATLFGDFGEILPYGVVIAAGVPGVSDTPSDKAATERLMRYWTTGPGAAKIRWGTPGDLTRAHRYLAKYVGPKRAWGLAQNLHKRVLGMPNATHDKITGQTK